MQQQDYSYLQELQPQSNVHLPSPVLSRIQNNAEPRALVRSEVVANGYITAVPKLDISQPAGRISLRKTKTLPLSGNHPSIHEINTALLGGKNYPVLTAVLGTATGIISFGAGLFVTAATTGLSLAVTSQRVLARPGDEIWHVEEIGKIRDGEGYKPCYISSFFLVDPYRRNAQANTKGWLIHEERQALHIG